MFNSQSQKLNVQTTWYKGLIDADEAPWQHQTMSEESWWEYASEERLAWCYMKSESDQGHPLPSWIVAKLMYLRFH